ncbi:NAD(P)/FAD-dependent oxidoreductase [Leisingera sp. ANG-DT]|uniref:NAD(P)/FAD-dependent oxidoreductase n=1 Tax=Leisingera sp. ANG-DT TaxID=1577897 RepID=UPI0005809EEB|nr:FAD-binding oxidoreductase [Leisingera sp. ANG-DT]KIC15830.1 amino acid dehydrogenase [Leisingera sp. ANG-DT]
MSHIVVIGGGVVGISCALELQDDGHQVTVLEPGPIGEGASWASCGSIAVSEVIPLSKPGIMMKAPGWLLDPLGPLTLRASSALGVLPWFLRFAANARASRIKAISEDIAALTLPALADLQVMLARYGLAELLRSTPVMELYDSPEELAHERGLQDMRRALGFQIDEITGQEAKEMEPSIASNFACATVFRDWRSVVDTKRFVTELHRVFTERGGTVKPLRATGFLRNGSGAGGVRTDSGETIKADQYVLAAGAWSKGLAGDLGVSIQMEGVIGYQTSLTAPGVDVTHAMVYAKGGFGITPYESGLAVAGSIEFAGLDAQPNWKRAEILVEKAKRVLPGLQTEPAERRIGRRPLTPDTKPIIGTVPGAANVILATGHGQLGLTLSATTGKLVRSLAAGRQPNIDMHAYRADRF